jgi:hypothetical protein
VAAFVALALIFSRFSILPWWFAYQAGHFASLPPGEQTVATIWFFLSLLLPGLPAPVALLLGLKAWSNLRSNDEQSGWGLAAFAIFIGLLGTLVWIFEVCEITRALWRMQVR